MQIRFGAWPPEIQQTVALAKTPLMDLVDEYKQANSQIIGLLQQKKETEANALYGDQYLPLQEMIINKLGGDVYSPNGVAFQEAVDAIEKSPFAMMPAHFMPLLETLQRKLK